MAIDFIRASHTGALPSVHSRGTILDNFKRLLRRSNEKSRIAFELNQMSSRELADLGLSPSDIPDVASGRYRRP